MDMPVDELSEPIPVSPRQAPPAESFFKYSPRNDSTHPHREEAAAHPNRTKEDMQNPSLSESSILNIRYIKRQPPTSPGASPHGNGGPSPGRPVSSGEDIPLSGSKMNKRYAQGAPNGPTAHNGEISNGMGGQHYEKNPQSGQPRGRKHRPGEHDDSRSHASASSDMDKWVDGLFDPVLDHDVNDLQDGRALQRRLKGGGDQRVIYIFIIILDDYFVITRFSS